MTQQEDASLIPESKREAVTRALRQTFGVEEFEEIQMLHAGLSPALVFRITVRGYPYLLRVITRTDAMNGPTRQFACMQSASEAGLAPRIWYSSIEDRISITGFVQARPFPIEEALRRLPAALARLHALPPFPRSVNYLDAMDGFVRRFRESKLLPQHEIDESIQLYSRVASVYPRDQANMVSSHNDLKPENILFDGDRVWFVDWEAAFRNDRYTDLAVVANFVVTNEAEEARFLQIYFGEAPGEYRRARFHLMRQLLHMFYAAVFLSLGATSGMTIDPAEKAPDFRDFHGRIWAGEVSLAGDEAKLQYGWVHLNQLRRNAKSRRLEEAIRTVYDARRNSSPA